MAGKKGLSAKKARQMLHDDAAQGHPLTTKQRGYFGAVASGSSRRMGPSRTRRARST